MSKTPSKMHMSNKMKVIDTIVLQIVGEGLLNKGHKYPNLRSHRVKSLTCYQQRHTERHNYYRQTMQPFSLQLWTMPLGLYSLYNYKTHQDCIKYIIINKEHVFYCDALRCILIYHVAL